MIYLSISVSAAATFDSQSYYIAFRSNTSSGTWKSATAGSFPYTLTSANSTINNYVFLGYKTNQVIHDESVIVATVKIDGVKAITLLGVGQPTSKTLFTETSITYAEMMAIPLSQEIIASTTMDLGNAVQHTVTFKAKGFTGQNAVVGYQLGETIGNGTAITLVNCDLYESIQEAASSGTTPEEMREVLSSWGEEELLPGIEDSVHSGVTSGMEEALENEKQEASSDGAASADELQGAIDEALGDIEEIQKPFETLGSALSYSGQSATLTFPGMNVPFLGQISQPVSVNLTQKISETMPTELLNIIRGVLSLALVVFPPIEVIRLFNKLLNKG